MTHFIRSFLAVVHLWMFVFYPTVQTSQVHYTLEVGIFDKGDDLQVPFKPYSEAPDALIGPRRPEHLTADRVQQAHGYFVNIRKSYEDAINGQTPCGKIASHYFAKETIGYDTPFVCKPSSFPSLETNQEMDLPFLFVCWFGKDGELGVRIPTNLKGAIQIKSPFPVKCRFEEFQSRKEPHDFWFTPRTDKAGNHPIRCVQFQQTTDHPEKRVITLKSDQAHPWELVNLRSGGYVKVLNDLQSRFLTLNTVGLNTEGVTLQAETVARLKTTCWQNAKGSFSGVEGTQVNLGHWLDNEHGQIGGGGQTHLTFQHGTETERKQAYKDNPWKVSSSLSYGNRRWCSFPYTKYDRLGTILGAQIKVQGMKELHLQDGHLIPQGGKVQLIAPDKLHFQNIKILTPLLEIQAPTFDIGTQADVDLTKILVGAHKKVVLSKPYATTGRVEVWQEGIKSKDQARQILNQREEKLEPADADGPVIDLLASVKAEKGLSAYAPDYKLHIKTKYIPPKTKTSDTNSNATSNSNNKEDPNPPSLDLRTSAIDAFVRSFDLEEGLVVAAEDSIVHAPNGIRIGRLVIDPTREVFHTIHANINTTRSYNLGSNNTPLSFKFLDKTIQGNKVYTHGHLFHLPVVISNHASFLEKESITFVGPFRQNGEFKTKNLILDSEVQGISSAGAKTEVTKKLLLKNTGGFLLRRITGDLQFQYWIHHPPGFRRWLETATYTFIISDPATMRVHNLDSTHPIVVENEGSKLFFHTKNSIISAKTKNLETICKGGLITSNCMYQKFINNPKQFISSIGSNHRRGIRPHHCIDAMGCLPKVYGFLAKTNNFSGERVFEAIQSSSSSTVFGNQSTVLQGALTAPALFIPVSEKGLILGALMPLPQKPVKKPVVDLASLGMNLHTTRYQTPQLKKFLQDNPQPRVSLFAFQERFWFNDKKAQHFYQAIKDDIVVQTRGAFKKASPYSVFSLAPTLLIEHVRKACMEKLNRPYFKLHLDSEKNKITAETVQQLHRNTSTYLKTHGHLRSQWPVNLEKPILYYVQLKNQAGLNELVPSLEFPQKMIEEANGISSKLMLVAPQGMNAGDLFALCRSNPKVFDKFMKVMKKNPQLMGNFMQALTAPPQTKAQTSPSHPSQSLTSQAQGALNTAQGPPTPNFGGNVILKGNFHVESLIAASSANLIIEGQLRGKNLIALAVENLLVQTQKIRESFHVYGGHGYQDKVISRALIDMEETLKLMSKKNIGFKGAKTQAKESEFLALGKILSAPLTLYGGQKRQFTEGDTLISEQSAWSTNVISSHTGGKLKASAGKPGIEFISSEVKGKDGDLQTQGSILTNEAHNTRSYQSRSTSEKKTFFGSRKKTHQYSAYSKTSLPTTIELEKLKIKTGKSEKIDLTHTKIKTTLGTEAITHEMALRAGVNQSHSQSFSTSSDFFRQKVRGSKTSSTTYSACSIEGPFKLKASKLYVESVGTSPLKFLKDLDFDKGKITHRFLKSVYTHESFSESSLTPEFCMLISLAVTLATAGVGFGGGAFAGFLGLQQGTVAFKMVAVGIKALGSQLTSKLAVGMANHGNPGQFFKDVFSGDGLRDAAITVGTAVALAGLVHQFDLPASSESFKARAVNAGLRAGIKTGFDSTIGGQDFVTSLKNNVVEGALNAGTGHFAQKIWISFEKDNIDTVTHKVLHGFVGAVRGGIESLITGEDLVRNIASGAAGAVVAETVVGLIDEMVEDGRTDRAVKIAEKVAKSENRKVTEGDIRKALTEETERIARLGQFTAGVASFVAHGNVGISNAAAENAVENNFLFTTTLAILSASSLIYSAYENYQTCKEQNFSKEVLLKTSMNVAGGMVLSAAGLGAAKLVFKGGKYVFKIVKNTEKFNKYQSNVRRTVNSYRKLGAKAWRLIPLERGIYIESFLAKTEYAAQKGWAHIGKQLKGKFPLVDFHKGNTLVSLKTVDTTGKTWVKRMKSHIIDLSKSGATIDGKLASMRLDIRVQPGGFQAAENALKDFAKQKEVQLIIKEFK